MSDMTLAATWIRGAYDLRRDAQKMLDQADEADEAAVKSAGWEQGATSRLWSHPALPECDGVKFSVALSKTLEALRLFGKAAK